ncbi:hypothetical protein LCGC14_1072000 [marine sediment metagenome]|uniref:DUF1643 domain-containing protein n=1 Tax=marine sediment metagenome TaxID=412755 RepID=A0A0F9Q114_9ZZZZ
MTAEISATDLMTGAVFSPDGKFRYALWRFWNYPAAAAGEAKAVMFTMANASLAGRFNDDPTTQKVARYAKRWGYDGFYVGNLFAVVDTYWTGVGEGEAKKGGPDCDKWLMTMRNSSVLHIAAWGFMGGYQPERAKEVRAMFPRLYHLGLSLKGLPKHPLYLSADQAPVLWE